MESIVDQITTQLDNMAQDVDDLLFNSRTILAFNSNAIFTRCPEC